MTPHDDVTVTLPRHLLGTTTNALRRAATRLTEESRNTEARASERAMCAAEAKWLTAAAQVLAEAARRR